MLVLSRRLNEVILIGDNIEIIVTRISKHDVRIGINAPKDVAIVRKELVKPKTLLEMARKVKRNND